MVSPRQLLFVDYSPFGAVSRGAVTLRKTNRLPANSDGAPTKRSERECMLPGQDLVLAATPREARSSHHQRPSRPTEAQL